VTVFEFAVYNYAARMMDPELLAHAQKLAKLADKGDEGARERLREIVLETLSANGQQHG